MKNLVLIFVTLVSISNAWSAPKEITCTGSSDFDGVIIDNLQASKQKISLSYSKNGEKYFKGYRTTVYFRRNGSTDAKEAAYYIEGSNNNETLTLPQYGKYKSGSMGSHFAFDHAGQRIIGVVSCTQK
jgi:hypothetical protein